MIKVKSQKILVDTDEEFIMEVDYEEEDLERWLQ